MLNASNHAIQRIKRINAAPRMTPDEQAQAIEDFINSGQMTHITTVDVIAHHDEVNERNNFGLGIVRAS